MTEKRRQYTEACKREAVRMVTERGYGVTGTARDLGINAKMLGRWKRQASTASNGPLQAMGLARQNKRNWCPYVKESNVCGWSARS